MALPHVIDRQLLTAQRVLCVTPQDAARVLARRCRGVVDRELPGSTRHAYLDDFITKPWGHEIRVYDDVWMDVWQLQINAGYSTSLHAHRRKETCLICIAGQGAISTGADEHIELTVGSVIHIRAGALHRSWTETGMSLVEVESPRDKFDLVRIDDSYGRVGLPYENPLASQPQPCPLVMQFGGPPRARLRKHSINGNFRFNLEAAAHARRRPDEVIAAIAVESPHDGGLPVLNSDALTVRARDELFLTVRTNT